MSNSNFYIYLDGKPIRVSEDVYHVYYKGERKERYFMEDLKTERIKVDNDAQTVRFVPSREDSYERLVTKNHQFASQEQSVEESVLTSALLETALQHLSDEEQKLIYELFFLGKTEREVSAELNLTQVAIHKRKDRVLKRLKNLLK